MSIAFISDLHLEPIENKRAKAFFQFIDNAVNKHEELYILGDFFEYWIGDDDTQPINKLIMQKLKYASDNGLKIYFIHGNRDFLVSSGFESETDVRILEDQYTFNLEDKKILEFSSQVMTFTSLSSLTNFIAIFPFSLIF